MEISLGTTYFFSGNGLLAQLQRLLEVMSISLLGTMKEQFPDITILVVRANLSLTSHSYIGTSNTSRSV